MMCKSEISFVIPTCDRPKILEYLLDSTDSFWNEKNNISIYVLDGSSKNDTENMIKRKEKKNLFYYHMRNTTISERVFKGIQTAKGEYICICGDSVRPKLENYNKLYNAIKEKYDLICLSYTDPMNLKDKEYHDIVEMFKECCWNTTHMGNTFFKKSSYDLSNLNVYYYNHKSDSYVQDWIYFDRFAADTFKGYFLFAPIIDIYDGGQGEKKTWTQNVIQTAVYEWDDMVSNADKKFDSVKNIVLHNYGELSSLKFNKYRTFIKLNMKGLYNFHIYNKYKESFNRTVSLSPMGLIIISILPLKLLCKPIIYIKNRMR